MTISTLMSIWMQVSLKLCFKESMLLPIVRRSGQSWARSSKSVCLFRWTDGVWRLRCGAENS